jgi:hypothetical protein
MTSRMLIKGIATRTAAGRFVLPLAACPKPLAVGTVGNPTQPLGGDII